MEFWQVKSLVSMSVGMWTLPPEIQMAKGLPA